jgi:AcrR family transcriptional regulator
VSTEEAAPTGVRGRLVEAVVRLLATEGPTAVQARRVAREIGASTMAVYHYFGGMPELLQAVSDHGFHRLDAHLAAVPVTEDPVTDICRLALAYRHAARENPHLYDLMFGLSAPGGHRPVTSGSSAATIDTEAAQGAHSHLVATVSRAMHADRIRTDDPSQVAAQLWSLMHGYVTLELSGQFSQFDDGLTQVLVPLGTNLLIGLGDASERAAQSATRALASA